MHTDLQVAQLIAARICHDLATPISAMSMGLELIDDPRAGALPMVKKSLHQARNNVALLRCLFSAPAPATLADATKTFQSHLIPTITFSGTGLTAPVAQPWPNLLLHLTFFGWECLPRDGDIQVHYTPQQLQLVLTSTSINLREEFREVLLGQVNITDITPRTIQVYWLVRLAHDHQLTIQLSGINQHLKLTISA